jgi:hypothetical protein
MNVIYSAYKSGGITKAPFFIMAAGVLGCTAINLVCYRVHLQLSGFERFINGLIPYLAATSFMAAILIILSLNRNLKDISR